MSSFKYVKPEKVALGGDLNLSEKWGQERIAEDPSILGLGDLILKDKERMQPRAGRLDLLLQDAETNRRYEVELQLGKTDETHIIRTIEYWDIERKRYPQYEHCTVIVAEDITSRFLNVISLFNGFIPLIAIQLSTIRFEDRLSLILTRVMDELTLGLVEEDEEVQTVADRAYWENRGSKNTVAMVDEIFMHIREFAPEVELKYNKFYISLAKDGRPNNFVIFKPRKNRLSLEVRLELLEETSRELVQTGLAFDYDKRENRYRINLTKPEASKHKELFTGLLNRAYDSNSEL